MPSFHVDRREEGALASTRVVDELSGFVLRLVRRTTRL